MYLYYFINFYDDNCDDLKDKKYICQQILKLMLEFKSILSLRLIERLIGNN
jgi:hypothetical protein